MAELFDYHYEFNGCKPVSFSIDIKIPLPSNTSLQEQVACICSTQKVPCYARSDLREKLEVFINSKTQEYFDKISDNLVEQFLNLPSDEAEESLDLGMKKFVDQRKGYAPSQTMDNEDLFSDVYQALLHSSNPSDIHELLQKEQSLCSDVQKLIRERNWEIDRLKKEHVQVVENTVKDMENDNSVADRASKHFERVHLVEQNYASQLSSLMESQRREYTNFVLKLHESQIREHTFKYYVKRGLIS